jgi:hypothetical protein
MFASVAACAVALGLAACGGSGGSAAEAPAQLPSPNAVAQVGSQVITKALLNEWMAVDIGSDYYEVTKRQVPAGLVSEPVDYASCTRALGAIAATSRLSATVQHSKCEALYQAIKEQTLTFLVGAYWDLKFAGEHGASVSDAEVQQAIQQVTAKEYPKPGEFQRSLKARRRTIAQERFLARIDLLSRALRAKVASKSSQYAKVQSEARAANDDAICRAEYIVVHCKEQGSLYTGPSPATLVRELAQ